MKRYLLIASEVVEFLEQLPQRERTEIWNRLQQIARSPDRFEEYQERDATGRELSGHVFRKVAILYWDDFADRHVKIMSIAPADEADP